MRSRRLVTRRTASAAVTTVAAGTPEAAVAAVATLAEEVEVAAIPVEGVAILGVEAAGREAGWACRDNEEAWAAREDKAIAGEAP